MKAGFSVEKDEEVAQRAQLDPRDKVKKVGKGEEKRKETMHERVTQGPRPLPRAYYRRDATQVSVTASHRC
jgi:hypothetical protein